MKKNSRLIFSSLLALVLVAAPAVSSAQGFDQNRSQGHPQPDQNAYASDHGKGNAPSASTNRSDPWFGWFDGFWNGQANNNNKNATDTHGFPFGFGGFGNRPGTTTAPTNLPPVIQGVSSPTVLVAGATGTWTVNASDPENGSLSYSVDWGDQAVQPAIASALATPVTQTSTFTHVYATAGTYTATFTVENSAGLTAVSSVTVRVVAGRQDTLAISGLAATSTSPRQARVSWTTNQPSNGSVWISTTSPVDTSGPATMTENGLTRDHSIALDKLAAGTTYYAVVVSAAGRGESATSSQISFTTPTPTARQGNAQAPTIASITGSSTIAAGATGTWSVTASDPRNESLTYSVDWGDQGGIVPLIRSLFGKPFVQTSTFTHAYANAGTYTITVTAKDSSGLSTTATTSVTVTAAEATVSVPVVSDIAADAASTTATVSWDTDQSSDSTVYYSTTTPVAIGDGSTYSVTDPTLVTSHSLGISGLATSTTYYDVVQSSDSAGTATSSESSFTTSSD